LDEILTNIMNYQKIYNQIIEQALNRKLEGYKEKHHIIPKCIGGLDIKENIIELTAREHFLCHRILCEIYPSEPKLSYALWLMAIGKQKSKNTNPYIISSRVYEHLRKQHSIHLKDIPRSNNVIEKMKKPKGPKSEEHKRKLSEATIGRKDSEETRKKKSESGRTKNMDWETRNKKASDKLKGRKIKWNLKGIKKQPHKRSTDIPILQFDLQGNFIAKYDKISEASKGSKSLHEGIRACINGKYKQSGGYIWKRLI